MNTEYAFDSMGTTGPYKCVGVWTAPAKALQAINPNSFNIMMNERPAICRMSCDYCGTGIRDHYIIQDSKGVLKCVGSDCVLKTGMTVHEFETYRLQVKKEKKIAKKLLDAEIALEKERQRNGGLTNAEISEKRRMVQEEEYRKQREEFYLKHRTLFDAVIALGNQKFTNMVNDITHRLGMTERQEKFLNDIVRQAKDDKDALNEPVGNPGDTIQVNLRLIRSMTIDTTFGPTTMSIMADEQGRKFIAYSSSNVYPDADEGFVAMKVKVKGHKVYNGTHQTIVNFPKRV